MKYWLLSAPIHGTDIQPSYVGKSWPYNKVTLDERLKGGDVVYLSFGGSGLYAWGHVVKKETYNDDQLGESYRVTVTRSVIRYDLVPPERIQKERELDGLFSFSQGGNLELLTVAQINALNILIRMSGEDAPPNPSDLDDDSLYRILHAGRPKSVPTLIHNQPVVFEETRYIEFKEVVGASTINSIKNTADEYAVALLNRQGGRVFWGIRNDRVVVGLDLNYSQRDEINREVSVKLSRIQPAVSMQEFSLEFYPVQDDRAQNIPDLYIFELDVPRGSPTELYADGSDVVWIKTDGGKQKLTHQQVTAEILRRKGR